MSNSPKHRRVKHRGQSPSGGAGSVGQVRIIAGRMRGRKLPVPDVEGLRPTGDRVRETLFNWLQGDIAGAHCLDLFAGSGALGFEAFSRYARSVTFVEPSKGAYRNLVDTCRLLEVPTTDVPASPLERFSDDWPASSNASQDMTDDLLEHASELQASAHLYEGTAEAAIRQWEGAIRSPLFDLVFIDPPFRMGCQWAILQSLMLHLLADRALVYLESPSEQRIPEPMPDGCELLREKRFGDVMVRLLRYTKTLNPGVA